MNPFKESLFFNLQHFPHRALWENTRYVWEALTNLSTYLNTQPLGNIEVDLPRNVFLENPSLISIGPGTVIEDGVFIKGPCIIGKNCIVRHGAYIRENVLIGDRSLVGHCSEIKHSIMLQQAAAPHFAFVGDSIVGNDVNLGAGVRLANLRIDRQKVSLFFGEEKFETGLIKFGSVLGDGVQIGCNAVLNPGTILGKLSYCYASVNIGGYFEPHSIIKNFVNIVAKKRHMK
ncbi:MAG: UDP-N-acetylglucosamine diphosphorylase [Parachlamydiales bacterium]|nr:UDP-N-acetylglucosamine diphosphorylase [Parachlamydiales bacterium]